jgi:hypothetical protein
VIALFFAINRAIEPSSDEQRKDEAFVSDRHYKMFSHFLKRVEDKSQLYPLTEKLVKLIKSHYSSQPILVHIFRAFLLRGISFDKVTEGLNKEELAANLNEFFEQKAQ